MSENILVTVNGNQVSVPSGSTVAVAVMLAGGVYRRSITGEPRGPLCGMGVCLECRVTINGCAHARSCQILCQPGMELITNGQG